MGEQIIWHTPGKHFPTLVMLVGQKGALHAIGGKKEGGVSARREGNGGMEGSPKQVWSCFKSMDGALAAGGVVWEGFRRG